MKTTEKMTQPSIYEGESFRTPYRISQQNWNLYNGPKTQEKSFMRQHTKKHHRGIIGEDRDKVDYKIHVTEFFTKNIDRQTNEGSRQTWMEELQRMGKVNVLNSQIDFNKPMETQLTILNKADQRFSGPSAAVPSGGQRSTTVPSGGQVSTTVPSGGQTSTTVPNGGQVPTSTQLNKVTNINTDKQREARLKKIEFLKSKFTHRGP